MASTKEMIRKRLQFYGRVQGVGFRYTAIRAANSLGVSGWVRNERDGSVTVEAQGSDAAIKRYKQWTIYTYRQHSFNRTKSH